MRVRRDVNPVHWDVMERDDGVCQYCRLDGKTDVRILYSLELDHLQPRTSKLSYSEQEHRDNLVVSCSYCNCCKRAWNPAHKVVFGPDPEFNRLQMIERTREYVLEQSGLMKTLPFNYWKDLFQHLNDQTINAR